MMRFEKVVRLVANCYPCVFGSRSREFEDETETKVKIQAIDCGWSFGTSVEDGKPRPFCPSCTEKNAREARKAAL